MQIARLERALELIGAQIDAGKPSAAHAFVRILDHLNRLAPKGFGLAAIHRIGDEVDQMAERLDRLDAAREALAIREAESGLRGLRDDAAQPKASQAFDNKGTGETADFAPSTISEA